MGRLSRNEEEIAIDRAVNGIDHDFNNLLGIIASFAGFLAQDLPEGTENHRYAHRILTACELAKALVARSLALACADRIPRRPTDIGTALRECRDLLVSIMPASTRLEFSISDEALRVCGDIGEFSQIILNLCINARDALYPRPGTIAVRLDRVCPGGDEDYHRTNDCGPPHAAGARIQVGRLDEQREYARLCVADSGTGIDPETLPQIFESFFTTKKAGYGAGLGLAVVRGVVLSYGGACRVESAPGRGTTFMVYLPLDRTDAHAFVMS